MGPPRYSFARATKRPAGSGDGERSRSTRFPLERVDTHAVDELPAFIDRDQLERGFQRLSVEERAIVVLHHVEGFPLAAIADVLAIPIGTVKSRLHRSLQTMRAALDADARVVTMDRERIA